MLKRLSFLNFCFFIIYFASLNARFIDVAIFLDVDQELNQMKENADYRGPITLDLSVALCQKNFPILTTSSLLYNIQTIKNNLSTQMPIDKALKSLQLDDKEWHIYQHRSKDLYLLIPKNYLRSIAKYNTNALESEVLKKYPQFTTDEVLIGFRINEDAGIFKKISWKNLEFDDYSSAFESWSQIDAKTAKKANWLEIFTQGTDDIFGLWNIILAGHGDYSEDFLSKVGIPKSISELKKNYGNISGLSFKGYSDFIQFLTNNVKTNFLYYVTCFGGDVNLILPYITIMLNEKGNVKAGIKKPNFTIAAAALTSQSVFTDPGTSLLECVNNTKPQSSYKMFFESLKKYAPEANKAVIYKDKELKEILNYVTDRIKEIGGVSVGYGITALPSVMQPGSEIFRAIELNDKISVISEVLLKKHTLAIKNGKISKEAQPIILQNKEAILIYPLEIPVEIKITSEQDKLPPAIVAMTPGMSIIKINNLNTDIGFFNLLMGSIGAVEPIFNKYFFINSLTTTFDDKKRILKNVLILVNDKIVTAVFVASNNKIYTWKETKPVVFKLTELNIPITNNVKDNDYIHSLITYFDSNDPSVETIKKDFDFESLFKLLSKEEQGILKQFAKENGTFNKKFKEADQRKADKEQAARDKAAKDKANKIIKQQEKKQEVKEKPKGHVKKLIEQWEKK